MRESLRNHKDGDDVEIWINSEGGDVFTAFDVVNLLAQTPRTKAIVTGLCASAGSIIAFGCDNVEMYENSYLMIHRSGCGAFGNSRELKKQAEILDKIDETIVNGYKKHLKDTNYDIISALDNETWFNSTEASDVFNITVRNGVPRNAIKPNINMELISNKLHYKNIPTDLLSVINNDKITDEITIDYDKIINGVVEKLEENRVAREKAEHDEKVKREAMQRILKNLEKEN